MQTRVPKYNRLQKLKTFITSFLSHRKRPTESTSEPKIHSVKWILYNWIPFFRFKKEIFLDDNVQSRRTVSFDIYRKFTFYGASLAGSDCYGGVVLRLYEYVQAKDSETGFWKWHQAFIHIRLPEWKNPIHWNVCCPRGDLTSKDETGIMTCMCSRLNATRSAPNRIMSFQDTAASPLRFCLLENFNYVHFFKRRIEKRKYNRMLYKGSKPNNNGRVFRASIYVSYITYVLILLKCLLQSDERWSTSANCSWKGKAAPKDLDNIYFWNLHRFDTRWFRVTVRVGVMTVFLL